MCTIRYHLWFINFKIHTCSYFIDNKHIQLIFFRYKIDDFQSEKTFVVSVNVSICLESNKPCDVHLEVIKNVKFPKPLCDFSGEFSIASMYCKAYS